MKSESMWSLWTFILLTGCAYGQEIVTKNVGESLQTIVFTAQHTDIGCYLDTPAQETYEFKPENNATDKFLLLDDVTFQMCRVEIKNLDENDTGIWTVRYVSDGGHGASSLSNSYNLTINLPETTTNVVPKIDICTKCLTEIEYNTGVGLTIDITLNNTNHEENCFLYNPDYELLEFADIEFGEVEGVSVHNSSQFVSCRVSIGPMTDSLLGKWTLCGKYTENEIEEVRCQPANITLTEWHVINRAEFNHVVNFGGSLNPVVSDVGSQMTSCNIITPNGEDLVITEELTYPGITSASTTELCSVEIGPIDASFLGDWILYGRFSSVLWFNEVRFPMHLSLYDEEYPYSKPYNVTEINSADHVVNLGNTLQIEVTSTGSIDACVFRDPSGGIYEKDQSNLNGVSFVDSGTNVACIISIGPIIEGMLGEWQLIGKFSNNDIHTEIQHTFHIIKEDPANPIQDDTRIIDVMASQYFNTDFGCSHNVAIYNSHTDTESCHLRTPEGLQYTIMEGFYIPGIEVMQEDSLNRCEITINVLSEDLIGDWTLISRETSVFSGAIERRLNFTIYVEKYVTAEPTSISIGEGMNMHVRLETATHEYDTCKLMTPNGDECDHCVRDESNLEVCSFTVIGIKADESGKWEITYGKKTAYRAPITVTVKDGWEKETMQLTWTKDRPVEEVVGPDDSVYCITKDPSGFTVFDGYGRCNISLERVNLQHAGVWKMHVALPGRILTDEYDFTVIVNEAEPKATVITHVAKEQPTVTISCSVSSQYEVRSCKFREPSGRVLFANQGVGEDRYQFHSNQVSFRSNINSHECGLRITNPMTQDLGLWRCALDTEVETYYGFLPVLCPWSLQNPDVAASVVTEPTLTAERQTINAVEGDSVIILCNVQSAIRYCYVRAQNGTIFSVAPGTTDDTATQYTGAGYDAGECGARLQNVQARDSGSWSCHVGFPNSSEPEQRVQINITVQETMVANQYVDEQNGELKVEGHVYNQRAVEYCRFVRIDGSGFTSDNLPEGYINYSTLTSGICEFRVMNPTILDHHPWTVAAKIRGQDEEITRSTDHTIQMPVEATEAPDPEPVSGGDRYSSNSNIVILNITLLITCIVVVIIVVLMLPVKNPKRNSTRLSSVKNWFYDSFRKTRKTPALAVQVPYDKKEFSMAA